MSHRRNITRCSYAKRVNDNVASLVIAIAPGSIMARRLLYLVGVARQNANVLGMYGQ